MVLICLLILLAMVVDFLVLGKMPHWLADRLENHLVARDLRIFFLSSPALAYSLAVHFSRWSCSLSSSGSSFDCCPLDIVCLLWLVMNVFFLMVIIYIKNQVLSTDFLFNLLNGTLIN